MRPGRVSEASGEIAYKDMMKLQAKGCGAKLEMGAELASVVWMNCKMRRRQR